MALEGETMSPGFWDDPVGAQVKMKRLAGAGGGCGRVERP